MSAPRVFREVAGLPDEKSGRKEQREADPDAAPYERFLEHYLARLTAEDIKDPPPVTTSGISIYRDPVV